MAGEKTDIDGSILTIADALAWINPDLLSIVPVATPKATH
jgi:hypothetical protein